MKCKQSPIWMPSFLILSALVVWNWATAADAPPKTVRTGMVPWSEAPANTGPWGEMRYFFQGESFGTKDNLAAVAVIEPGQSLHPAHRHAEEEYLFITKGSGRWSVDGKEFDAHEGDVLYVEPWVMHGLVNTGKEPLTFAVVKWTSKGVTPPAEPEGDHGR